ncbi:MAG: DUF2284 domain-containing protein [Clostridiales bacterium]|nr:DUF2284 domain-containing protein [Clostridiales bacterium]
MNNKEIIENTILQYPICEYYFGKTEELIFSDKVWYICEQDCERYGHSWACPPHCGRLEDLMNKCLDYSFFCLFSTVTETENAWDNNANLSVKRQHEEVTRNIREALEKEVSDFYVLSTGCTECEVCACPDEPCRHPEGRLSSMESHGILVMQTVEETGLTFHYGGDTIVYFSMILYNDTEKSLLSLKSNTGGGYDSQSQ